MSKHTRAPDVRQSKSAKASTAPGQAQRGGAMSSQRLLQMQKSMGNRAVARYLSAARQGVIQGKFEFDGESYEKETTQNEEVQRPDGSEGKITKYQADESLPTFYGVLKKVFGDNLNDGMFVTPGDLGENCDRPHTVSALITKNSQPDTRQANATVTAIGRLGNEELLIRDGLVAARETAYDGGHLVGYQVLGGLNADREWNVAPQDRENNQGAYNYTIEQMLRKAKRGTVINYEVELGYKSLNFAVDQNQLHSHGIIKALDQTKPWEVQLPSRIPYKWEANASISNAEGSFGKPAENTSSGDDEATRTYKQLTNSLETDTLRHDDSKYTARYMLKYEDSAKQAVGADDVMADVSKVRSINYRMMQVQAEERDRLGKPGDWAGPEKSNFGEVKEDIVTLLEITSLEQDLKDLLKRVQGPEEDYQDSQSYVELLNEIPDDATMEQAYELGHDFEADVMPEHEMLMEETSEARLFFSMKATDETIREKMEEDMGKDTDVVDDKSPQMELMKRKLLLKMRINRLRSVEVNRERRKKLLAQVRERRTKVRTLMNTAITKNKVRKKYSIKHIDKRKLDHLFNISRGATGKQILAQIRYRLKNR